MGERKILNLALQGGGAHGAFAWGVLDRILEDGRLDIEGICATSAGSMNAILVAHGLYKGDRETARQDLHDFWYKISRKGALYSPVKPMFLEKMLVKMSGGQWSGDKSVLYRMFETFTRAVSPYQFNPMNVNPLRELLEESIDFEFLKKCEAVKLFISATHVKTGKVRVFKTNEIDIDVVLASACLPYLFQAVEVKGEYFWDGGYMGNPALFPLFYHVESQDILIVHINPLVREELPTKASQIMNRINEISFNSSLLKEMRAIAFVQKMISEGWIKDEFKDRLKNLYIHSIRTDKAMCDLSIASKFNTNWSFLQMLRDRGRTYADEWLDKHYADINVRSSVDLHKEFLGLGSSHIG